MRIAVLTGDWNIEIMKEFLHGVNRYAQKYKTAVCVFNCFGADDCNTPYSSGEYNIYTLPDWKDFDGIIIEGNLVFSDDVRQNLWHEIQATGVPAIVSDYAISGCPFFGVNNYEAMSVMMEHILSVHHCRKVYFAAGPAWHEENIERLRAYREAMEKYGLTVNEDMVYYGNFHINDGTRIADEIIKKGDVPEAIVCANDEMACGVCEGLKKYNILVPRDILVTGFDGIQEGEDYCPSITTIKRFYNQQGYDIMKLMDKHISEGTPLPARTEAKFGFSVAESCNCEKAKDSYDQSLRIRHFYTQNYKNEYNIMQDGLHEKMLEAQDLDELANSITANSELFGCDSVALCFNRDFYLALESGTREYRDRGYADQFVTYDDKVHIIKRRNIINEFSEKIPDGGVMIFYPLHFKARVFGFFVLFGYPHSMEEGMIHGTLTMIELSIENVRVKTVLEQYNKKLDELYVRDSLTGLYNRFGYTRYAQQLFDKMRRENQSFFIMFMDVDKLKYINDTYGHELGDYAIKIIAEIIKESCKKDQIAIRYGGDEYLMIGSFKEQSDVDRIYAHLRRGIQAFNRTHTIYFDLDMSIGYTLSLPGDNRTLDECTHAADEAMYEEKKKKKVCRLPS